MYGLPTTKFHCLMCGKEWTVPEPEVQRHFLCRDCTWAWLVDYFRRLKSRLTKFWRRLD
jgi:DNA-directed RNA polymerase subunit RPC12/RpoP